MYSNYSMSSLFFFFFSPYLADRCKREDGYLILHTELELLEEKV
jgi:hypothetical protein